MSSIHIKITDGIKLKTGSKQMTFNESGGYIGSATDCQWVVQDVFNKINDKHVHIKSNGDNFCLMPCKGSQVYMNGDHSPIITNYYIILSIGDTFKIGDIEFTIIPESDLDDLADGITDNSMEDIKDFDKLDNYVVIPDGQLNGHNVEDDVNIDDLINDERDILGIEENSIEQVVDNCEHNILQNKLISKQILRDFVINECDIILNSELKKQTSLLDILSSEKSNISNKDLAYIVANYNLINNTKVINLLVISMLFKELDSPFFNELEDDGYEKIISTLIRSATTDQSSIERLVLHAVKKYIGEKNESN